MKIWYENHTDQRDYNNLDNFEEESSGNVKSYKTAIDLKLYKPME